MSDDLTRAHQRLEEATAARAEARRLRSRRDALEHDLQAAREQAREHRSTVAAHEEEFGKLTRPSLTRVLASLGGNLTDKVSEGQAEGEKLRYSLGAAEDKLARLAQEADQLEGNLARLGDETEPAYEEALSQLVALARAEGRVGESDVVRDAQQRLDRLQRAREVEEAIAAGEVAVRHLHAARRRFSAASDWSTYDLIGGGGLLTGVMKHDRLDKATDDLRAAAAAVERFSHELGDVHLPGVDSPVVDSFERGIDLWFDNVFTDWRVNERINEASKQLNEVLTGVERSMTRLRDLRFDLADHADHAEANHREPE